VRLCLGEFCGSVRMNSSSAGRCYGDALRWKRLLCTPPALGTLNNTPSPKLVHQVHILDTYARFNHTSPHPTQGAQGAHLAHPSYKMIPRFQLQPMVSSCMSGLSVIHEAAGRSLLRSIHENRFGMHWDFLMELGNSRNRNSS
jgi:hypothetical protein